MPKPNALRAALVAALLLPNGALCATVAPPPPLNSVDALAITATVSDAAKQGLPAINVDAAVAGISSPDPAVRAAADQRLSAAAVSMALATHGAIADPTKLDPNFALKQQPYDAAAAFDAARRAGRVPEWVSGLLRQEPNFVTLLKTRDAYAAIVRAGGWPTIPPGAALKPGQTDARVPLLRRRLAVESYGAPEIAATPNLFDPALAAALVAFQAHHSLATDGVLATATIAALNVPAADRLAAIDANLERARWLPTQLPADRIEVDTGDPQVVLFVAGAPVLSMRAIAGRPADPTPTFESKVTGVEFNPPWIVPADIAARELFPKQSRSASYFARNDYYVADGQVIQRAGPKAALGYLKFVMPDAFSVYLHDTPARSLFAHDRRWLSHGCVRLQNPRDLAAAVLSPQGWNRPGVDAMIATGVTRTVTLTAQPAVFIVYRTVIAAADGRAAFRPDVYGWDAKIEAALAAR